MSRERLEKLDPELEGLLDAERAAMPPAAALERVWSRVAGGTVPSGHAGHAGHGVARAAAPAGAGAGAGWHAVGVAVATFVVGGLVGAGTDAVMRKKPAERIVYVDRPSAPLVVSSVAPSPAAPSTEPLVAPPPRAGAGVRAAPSSLAAERALLDDARGALGSGDAAKALTLLDEHGRRFPRGQLGEEREALAIQALVLLARNDEARARGARFRQTWPRSLFMPAIDTSLESIP